MYGICGLDVVFLVRICLDLLIDNLEFGNNQETRAWNIIEQGGVCGGECR